MSHGKRLLKFDLATLRVELVNWAIRTRLKLGSRELTELVVTLATPTRSALIGTCNVHALSESLQLISTSLPNYTTFSVPLLSHHSQQTLQLKNNVTIFFFECSKEKIIGRSWYCCSFAEVYEYQIYTIAFLRHGLRWGTKKVLELFFCIAPLYQQYDVLLFCVNNCPFGHRAQHPLRVPK